ncbi:hypothetical protein GCM10008992_14140 [Halorubrum aquaticum]
MNIIDANFDDCIGMFGNGDKPQSSPKRDYRYGRNDIHFINGENVAIVFLRSDSCREAIRAALNELPDVPAPDWDKPRIVHNKDDVYVVRMSRTVPGGW